MQFPRASKERLMLAPSTSLTPLFCVAAALAVSREDKMECNSRRGDGIMVYGSDTQEHKDSKLGYPVERIPMPHGNASRYRESWANACEREYTSYRHSNAELNRMRR